MPFNLTLSADQLAVEGYGLGGGFTFEDVELVGELVERGVDGCGVGGAVFELHAKSVEVLVAGDGFEPLHEREAGGGEVISFEGQSV